MRTVATWFTRRFWSRLDGIVLLALGWLIGARPRSLLTEVACLIAFMFGVRALSVGLRKLARVQEPPHDHH